MSIGFKFKTFTIIVLTGLAVATVAFCAVSPKMHKPFQLNIIEYIMKINSDGSITSTKSVTTTVIKEEQGK